jgi:predicted Zn-dependent protease
MRRWIIATAVGSTVLAGVSVVAQQSKEDDGGVRVRPPSLIRKLVPAANIEKAALQQYEQLRAQATSRSALVAADDAQAKRIQRIAQELLPHATKWNPRAKDWQWEVILVKTNAINAFCMPGGKIAVFSGILDTLKLTDDELAVVLGHEMAHALREHGRARAAHEMAHALREHGRARAAKHTLTNIGTLAASLVIGGDMARLAHQGGGLLNLKFNRDDERDADLIGMEIAARAGYNPEAGISLWEKMGQAARARPLPWLSTHATSEDRIARMQAALKDVAHLYQRARASKPATATPN